MRSSEVIFRRLASYVLTTEEEVCARGVLVASVLATEEEVCASGVLAMESAYDG